MRFSVFLVFAGVLAGAVAGGTAQADFVNGGFEAATTLTNWNVHGSAQIVTASFGKTPPAGVRQAYLDNDQQNGAVDVAVLEAALLLPAGELSGGTLAATSGSAISQTVTATANQGVQFSWDFLTAEDPTLSPSNDFSFAVVRNTTTNVATVTVLGDYAHANIPLPFNGTLPSPSTDDYLSETGYGQTTLAFGGAGTYEVSFGVANRVNKTVASALLVDKVAVVPEPGSASLLTLAGFALAIRRRKARTA